MAETEAVLESTRYHGAKAAALGLVVEENREHRRSPGSGDDAGQPVTMQRRAMLE
jgi:hypothetical protein